MKRLNNVILCIVAVIVVTAFASWRFLSAEELSIGLFVEIAFSSLILIFILLVLDGLVWSAISYKMAELKTTPASVFSKMQDNTKRGSVFYAAFTLPDGTRKNLRVPLDQYNILAEGENGTLAYREYERYSEFVRFTVEKKESRL